MKKKKKGKIVLSRKKAIILFGSVIGLTLLVWIGLMVVIFSGQDKPKGPEGFTEASDASKIKRGYKKYSVQGDTRELVEAVELDKKNNVIKRILYYQNSPAEVFEYTYDRFGRQIGGTYKNTETSGYFRTEYNTDGDVLSKEWDNYPFQGGVLSKGEEQYEYDRTGNLLSHEIKQIDMVLSNGAVTKKRERTDIKYDDAGRILLHRDVTYKDGGDEEDGSHEIRYEYYDNGNLKYISDVRIPAANMNGSFSSETFYRENGEKEKMCEYISGELDYTTEYSGNTETRIPAEKQEYYRPTVTKTVAYDSMNRLISSASETVSGVILEEYEYLDDGRILKRTQSDYYYEYYDDAYYDTGIVSSGESGYTKKLSHLRTDEYKYDGPNGEITEETHSSYDIYQNGSKSFDLLDQQTLYDYDSSGNMIKKYVKDPQAAYKTDVYEWIYDEDGRMIRESRKRGGMKEEVYEWEYLN